MASTLQDLGQAIKRLEHLHHRTLDIRLAPLKTTLVQWDALRHISENPDSSSHALALLTFQTDQSFGALAARLEDQRLIKREAGKGRVILHHLTPPGKKLLAAGNTIVEAVLAESFSVLNAGDRRSLQELLARLLETTLEEKTAKKGNAKRGSKANAVKKTRAKASR